MNAKKNAVLRTSPYTTALTKSIKGSSRLSCQTDEAGRTVYVCNGFLLAKLSLAEYDALIRPITQREAGTFALDQNGDPVDIKPMDLPKLLADAAARSKYELTPAPFLFDSRSKSCKTKIVPYYSKDGNFVAGFNADYVAILSSDLPRKGKDPISPMVICMEGDPLALILPIRLGREGVTDRIPAAVRAWFDAGERPESAAKQEEESAALRRHVAELQAALASKDEQIENLTGQLNSIDFSDNWQNKAHLLELERDEVRRMNADAERALAAARDEIAQLKAALASKSEQIDALTERLNDQPDPQPAPQSIPQEEAPHQQAPADKAAALADELNALGDITATVKGAKTAAPVIWLSGKADAHKEKIVALGGLWSNKRGAWYFKIA